MEKFLLSAVSLTALTGSAFAADLPSRKELIVAPPAPPMWTGFYAGLNAGGTWANSTSVEVAQRPAYIHPRTKASPFNTALAILAGGHTIPVSTPANFMGGVQIGYNEKVKEHYVVGFGMRHG